MIQFYFVLVILLKLRKLITVTIIFRHELPVKISVVSFLHTSDCKLWQMMIKEPHHYRPISHREKLVYKGGISMDNWRGKPSET